MSISASQIVSVVPRVINAGGTDLEITGLFLTKNPLCVFPGTLSYTSADAVGAYFGLDSAEYETATNYFLGYDNSFKKPRRIHFARYVKEDIPAALIGAQAASMSELKAITSGELNITVNGTNHPLTSLDFSTAKTQSDVAKAVQDVLTGTTVSYNSNLNAFIISVGAGGASTNITFATGTAADAMGLTEDAGATISAGSDALSPSENMNSIKNVTQNWVSFTTMEEETDDVILEFADWTNDTNGEYLYCPWTTQGADINPNASTNLPKKLADSNYEGVLLTYGGLDKTVLAMSIAACIDWDRNNSIVTWAFKSQTGLSADVADDATAANCETLRVNFYGKYATRNDEFIYYYQGRMSGGKFEFVDAYVGNLWLRNALQVSIMNGLNQAGRVPYNEDGYTFIRAWCNDPINRAINNGVINNGVTLSESQRAQLMSEAGLDISNNLVTEGFYLKISDPGAQARQNRDTPILGLWYTYAGSVHKINLPVTVVL